MKKIIYCVEKIKYKNHEIQTYNFGSGEKIIFALPPFPSSGLFFLEFFEQYDSSKFKVITFDLPGWSGDSDDIYRKKAHTLDDYLEIAKAVLTHYKVESFSLLGYSFGGGLSIKLAAKLKDQINSIVLVSPVFSKKYLTKDIDIMLVNFANKLKLSYLLKYSLTNKLLKLYKLNRQDLDNERLKIIKRYFNNIDSAVILKDIYTLFNSDWTSDLDILNEKPVMIVNSRNEKRYFRKQAEHLRRALSKKINLYITGRHEDFLLVQDEKTCSKVVEFLIK